MIKKKRREDRERGIVLPRRTKTLSPSLSSSFVVATMVTEMVMPP
jgi:hypothetical protein